MYFDSVKFWKDPGFTEGSVEVPSYASCGAEPSGTADLEVTDDMVPSKGRLFSELKIRTNKSWSNIVTLSYLKAVMTNSPTGSFGVTYYGWVDRVDLLKSNTSTTDFYIEVLITWHIDLWRTYFRKAEFGYGMVTQRPASSEDPPQDFTARYWKQSTALKLTNGDIRFAIVCYLDDSTTSATLTALAVPFTDSSTESLYIAVTGASSLTTFHAIPLVAFYNGTVADYLGIKPANIVSCFISPMLDKEYTVSDVTGGRCVQVNHSIKELAYGTLTYGAFKMGLGLYSTHQDTVTLDVTTDERHQYSILDLNGSIVGTLPFGVHVTGCSTHLALGATSAYLVHRFTAGGLSTDTKYLNSVGLEMHVPLPTVPVSDNSWSEYVYSGSREYDIESRKLNQEISYKQGLAESITSGVTGATIGGLKSGGAAAGFAAISALGSIASSVVSNAIAVSYFDELQGLEDSKEANQSENILMDGESPDWFNFGTGYSCLVGKVPDDYSSERYADQVSLNGVQVSEPTADCTSLCQGTGPLRITNLVVLGDIPAEAKQYIKARFNNGVRLITES